MPTCSWRSDAPQTKRQITYRVLDLRPIASFTEFFIIASGSNQRQVQAIADEINEQLKKQMDRKAIRVEGYTSGEWVLLDYGDFVVQSSIRKRAIFMTSKGFGVMPVRSLCPTTYSRDL